MSHPNDPYADWKALPESSRRPTSWLIPDSLLPPETEYDEWSYGDLIDEVMARQIKTSDRAYAYTKADLIGMLRKHDAEERP